MLPAAKKQAVIEAMLNGISLRRIAEMADCRFNFVKCYRGRGTSVANCGGLSGSWRRYCRT
jgi:hypothetical protein